VHAPEWLAKISVQRGQRQERRFWQAVGGFDRNIVEPKRCLSWLSLTPGN
jgi:hypothetical protein